TQTPILLSPNISAADGQANEPASGSAPMLFTISLSSPAPAGGASVHYETADQAPALNHAVAGVDYTAVPDTVLNFAAGEQFKTVSVTILADANLAESNETFLLNLSNPTNAVIVDGEAIGTIKQGNASGTFLISELRTSGPGGAGDDFVELYNNSDTPLTIGASDASGGYGLFKMGADCNATPVLIGVIPNGTVIPPRGHYLFVGSAYSLANYGGTGAAAGDQVLTQDIESDRNVGIFSTTSLINLSTEKRLDAVGFGGNTGAVCDLLREGTTLTPLSGSMLEYSYFRDECGKNGNPAIFGLCPTGGFVKDSNVNSEDFIFVDTAGTVTPAGQRLGAPGPQNLASARLSLSVPALLLDATQGAPAPPNRVRDFAPLQDFPLGTMSVRRRFVNNTGANVTRLRFRIVDFSSLLTSPPIADLRVLTSMTITIGGINDTATCAATGSPATPPCSVPVVGTTLEQPPVQSLGGALNSSLSAGTITLPTPLTPGQSINLQFLLGVKQTGAFKFFFNIEALP
ncbi:MAG TPA: Calx-beta domain-containing protein, partial [Pyrinomonadaceae bacterium]|nr:Calx-beta domain-containing protein [Pyrinomonadaceae bacterium]